MLTIPEIKEFLSYGDYTVNRAKMRKLFRNNVWQASDGLAGRARLSERIQSVAKDGLVGIFVRSTDCDHCTATSLNIIPASVIRAERFERDVHREAEGATYISYVDPKEEETFEASFRDGIAEAYEDGHPHVVYQ
jgi:hypothetical protein